MTNFRRRLAWAVFLLLGLLVASALCLRAGAGWYLQSARFQKQITAAVSEVLKAEGSFLPLHFADGTLYADGFAARGGSAAFFSQLRADQIRAVLNWRGLLDRRWEIDELKIENLDVRFAEHAVPEPTPKADGGHAGTVNKWKLDLRRADVARSSWIWTTGEISSAAFTLRPDDGAWLIEASSGTVTQSGWPELVIESAKLRYTGATLFVTESALRAGAGRLAVRGEVNFDRAAELQASFENIPVSPLLPSDWRLRLHGNLTGTARVHASLPNGMIRSEGNFQLVDGQLEALPLLDQIATFTRTERFRRVALTRAALSFTRDAALTTAKDILLESEGLMRVEGACTIVNGQIDGVFQIGVTAASLQWLPGSQTRVFTIAHDGYFWTPLRVSGPIAHPSEDLTRRLVAAAAGELLDRPADTLRDAAKTLLDLIPH